MSLDNDLKEAFRRHSTDVEPRPGAWTDVERRVGRRHRRRLVTTAAGTALAIAAAVVVIPRIGGRDDDPPVTSGDPSAIATIPAGASRLAASNVVWAIAPPNDPPGDRGKLLRVNPKDNDVYRIDIGFQPVDVAADGDSVWVAHGSTCEGPEPCAEIQIYPGPTNSVWRIDARTNEVIESIRVEKPHRITVAFGSVWVTTAGAKEDGATLVRISTTTNTVVATIPLGGNTDTADVTFGDRYIWVILPTNDGKALPVRVDPQTNETTRFTGVPGSDPGSVIDTGFGSLWMTTSGEQSASGLARLDPMTGGVETRITLPDAAPVGLTAITTGEGHVWATSARGFLWKVDPLANKPARDPILIGDPAPVPGYDVVVAFGSVWVASGDGNIYRLTP